MRYQPERSLTQELFTVHKFRSFSGRNEISAREGIDTPSSPSERTLSHRRNEISAREGIDTHNRHLTLWQYHYPVEMRYKPESKALVLVTIT